MIQPDKRDRSEMISCEGDWVRTLALMASVAWVRKFEHKMSRFNKNGDNKYLSEFELVRNETSRYVTVFRRRDELYFAFRGFDWSTNECYEKACYEHRAVYKRTCDQVSRLLKDHEGSVYLTSTSTGCATNNVVAHFLADKDIQVYDFCPEAPNDMMLGLRKMSPEKDEGYLHEVYAVGPNTPLLKGSRNPYTIEQFYK